MAKVDQKLLDTMAELEVQAILRALQNPEECSPAWAARARAFLKDNRLETSPLTPGAQEIEQRLNVSNQREAPEIPIFTMPISEH